jgi:ribosomal protein S18 acetylase RimI-like enzyme
VHRRLSAIDAFLDAGPRPHARVEELGPFTLFVSRMPWPYYARPRLGERHDFTPEDVEAVRARQRGLGVPEHFSWVHELAPTLRNAMPLPVLTVPLLILEERSTTPARDVRLLTPDDPALRDALAVEQVSFSAPGTATGPESTAARDEAPVAGAMLNALRERLIAGTSITAVAEDETGPIAVGTLRPLGDVAEIIAVATLPAHRRRGLGGAVTAALVDHALTNGVETVFLSAADDDVARVYERLGFRRAATACFVQ